MSDYLIEQTGEPWVPEAPEPTRGSSSGELEECPACLTSWNADSNPECPCCGLEISDCVEWTAGRSGNYGVQRYEGHSIRAHQAAWLQAGRELPAGMVLHHQCENPLCVNVDHLQLLTRAEHGRRHHARRKTCPTCGGDEFYIRPDNGKRQCVGCRARRRKAHYEKSRTFSLPDRDGYTLGDPKLVTLDRQGGAW